MGCSGDKHQKGEKGMAILDHHGYVCAPVPVAPVNEADMVRLPEGLQALQKGAQEGGVDLRGASLTLDGGFASAHTRQCIFQAGLMPNIPENPRHRTGTKRGRQRLFHAVSHA